MTLSLAGLHHVTAICGDPQRNLDFYSGVLGLRLVKRTINFDDPSTYHLYYGDYAGTPGTILTFFAWPGARRGNAGTGQVEVTSLSIPAESVGYWSGWLQARGVVGVEVSERLGSKIIAFADPDGMRLELVADGAPAAPGDGWQPWEKGPVPAEHAIRGLHGVAASLRATEATTRLLTETLALRSLGPVAARRTRFASVPGEGPPNLASQYIDLIDDVAGAPGSVAVGSVHHVAWRVADDAAQQAWREKLAAAGFGVSPVMDRTYFHSIYFREPGGVLFEIATNPPGFAADGETLEALGSRLQVPPWLEPQRELLERTLPPLREPAST